MTETQTEEKKQIIVCSNCKGEYAGEDGRRKEERDNGLIEIGYRCPHCDHWTHGAFLTPELLERWEKLEAAKARFRAAPSATSGRLWDEYKKMRAAYGRAFDQTQTKLRRKYKVSR